jgi:hypothetical protein
MDTNMGISHLHPARADAARRAEEAVFDAARAWAQASKYHVGAVALPGDEEAARAFEAFHDARGELACHVGGAAAARCAAGALSAVAGGADAAPAA